MSWIDDNKGQGPWAFTEQPNKWGYLNNPRWSAQQDAQEFCGYVGLSLDSEETHKPCGHWHKQGQEYYGEGEMPGNLYGTGRNDYGQLGFESTTIGYSQFKEILESGCSQVACHRYHTLLVKTDGTLWATGWNYYGQLGTGDETTVYEFTQIGSGTNWSQVATGYGHSLAIKTDGSLWATGYNEYGSLGLGDNNNRNTFTQVGSGTDWSFVVCGNFHTVAIKTDGTLWSTGFNHPGQLGLGDHGAGTDRNTFTQVGSGTDWDVIDCGYYHTVAIKSDGSLWGTGDNGYGQLGLGDYSDRDIFTQIGSGTNWSDIGTGEYHTMAVKSDGTLWAVGYNVYGQLGVGSDTLYFNTIQQVGADTDWSSIEAAEWGSMGIKTDSTMMAAGTSYRGQLSYADGYSSRETTFQDVSGTNWAYVSQGWYHTIAIRSNGSLWGCGWNYYGQLGVIPEFQVDEFNLVNDDTWDFVSAWDKHTLAIRNDGTIWGTGWNIYGQLGLGNHNVDESLEYKLIQLSNDTTWTEAGTGTNHSAAIKSNGTLWATGRNNRGQLGLNDTTDRTEWTQVAYNDWIHIAAGSEVTMGIREDKTLWSWGSNSGGNDGQLGLNDTIDRHVPTQCIGTGWKQVSVGGCHAGAVRLDGTLWTTGKNSYGQLGLGDNAQRIVWTQVSGSDWDYVECGWNHTLAVKTDGTMYMTGYNLLGQLGLGDHGAGTDRNTFTQVGSDLRGYGSGGQLHSLNFLSSGVMHGTGANSSGQLGIGNTTDKDEFTVCAESIPVDGITDIWEFVACGASHSMALKIVSGSGGSVVVDENYLNEPQVWRMDF